MNPRNQPMMKASVILLITAVFGLSSVAHGQEVAIIVNKANATSRVSFQDLAMILKQQKQHWENGEKIYLVMQESGSFAKELALEKIYRMREDDLKKFWLTQMFRGEITSFPKTLGSDEAIKRFVSQVPNSVGFIDVSFIDESVKVLRVEGKFPGEKGYLLSRAAVKIQD